MAVQPIAYSYWRLIKAGNRTYASVPTIVKEDVKAVAKEEVVSGVITTAQYEQFIGEAYTA